MIIEVFNWSGSVIGQCELNDDVFACETREDLIHRVITWQLAKRRAGTHSALGRSDVRGSTRKIHSQKGSGRARHGSRKAPQFRKGGVTFGPSPRSYLFKINKKVRKIALASILSEKQRIGKIKIVETSEIDSCKTSSLLYQPLLQDCNMSVKSKVLLLDVSFTDNIKHSSANLPHLNILPLCGLNVYDITRHHNILITKNAVDEINNKLRFKNA